MPCRSLRICRVLWIWIVRYGPLYRLRDGGGLVKGLTWEMRFLAGSLLPPVQSLEWMIHRWASIAAAVMMVIMIMTPTPPPTKQTLTAKPKRDRSTGDLR